MDKTHEIYIFYLMNIFFVKLIKQLNVKENIFKERINFV
jgi:hypothetical protein